MKILLLFLIYGMSAFLVIDGLVGIIKKKMWTFRYGGYGPIPTEGHEALFLGIIYLAFGVAMFILGMAFQTLLFK